MAQKRNGRSAGGLALVVLFLLMALTSVRGTEARKGSEATAAGATAVIEADLVWAESDGGDYEIYLSRYRDGSWSSRIQVTENSDMDIVPAVTRDHNGVVWIVWTKVEETGKHLYFITFDGHHWTEETRIETGLGTNLSAALIADREGQLWLFWAGFDGVDDDIFFSRWEGAGWSPADRVNQDDVTPDLQPYADIGDDGLPTVQWTGFTDGEYQRFQSRWNGAGWDTESAIEALPGDADHVSSPAKTQSSAVSEPVESLYPIQQIDVEGADGKVSSLILPGFLVDARKAGIYISANGIVHSRPVRSLLRQNDTP